MKLFQSACVNLNRNLFTVGMIIQEVHQAGVISSLSASCIFISFDSRLHAVWDSAAQVRQVHLRVFLCNGASLDSMGNGSLCIAVFSAHTVVLLYQFRLDLHIVQHSGGSKALCRASWDRSYCWVKRYLRCGILLWGLLVDCDFIIQERFYILFIAGNCGRHNFLFHSVLFREATEDAIFVSIGRETVAGRSDYAISFRLLLRDKHDLWNDNR